MRKLLLATTAAVAGALTLSVPQAHSQQAPQGARPRFTGFTHPDPVNFDEHAGWTSLFDGKTLTGWAGDANWKVEDGAIVVESTCEKPTGTIYLVWQGGEASDFELKLEMKGTGQINGGVQYRGWIAPNPQRGQRPGGAGAPAPGAGATPPAAPAGAPQGNVP